MRYAKIEQRFNHGWDKAVRAVKRGLEVILDHVNIISSSDYLKLQRAQRELKEKNANLRARVEGLLRNLDGYDSALRQSNKPHEVADIIKRYVNLEQELTKMKEDLSESLGLVGHLKSSRKKLILSVLEAVAIGAGKAGYAAGVVNPRDEIVYVNKALLKLTRYDRGDILEKDYTKFLVGEEGILRDHFYTPNTQVEEITVVGKKGKIPMRLIKAPVIDKFGKYRFHIYTYFELLPVSVDGNEKPSDKGKIEEEGEKLKRQAEDILRKYGPST